jgi:hypothetical protein
MAISQRRRKELNRTTVAAEPGRDMMTLFGIVARNRAVSGWSRGVLRWAPDARADPVTAQASSEDLAPCHPWLGIIILGLRPPEYQASDTSPHKLDIIAQ